MRKVVLPTKLTIRKSCKAMTTTILGRSARCSSER
jgi:hypothetical protein